MAGDRLPRKVMDPKKLAILLRNGAEGTLVIDSRSFVEYNSWHVLSSVNICCSKLVKRRLQQDKVSITELIQPASKMKVLNFAFLCPRGPRFLLLCCRSSDNRAWPLVVCSVEQSSLVTGLPALD